MSVSMCMPMIKYDDYAGNPVKDDQDWENIKREKTRNLDDVCSICLEFAFHNNESREAYQFSGCGHVFHVECIAKALETNNKCPNCRDLVNPSDQAELITFRGKRVEHKKALHKYIFDNRNTVRLVDFGLETDLGKLMKKYKLEYSVYRALVINGTLTVDNMQDVQADPNIVSRLIAKATERNSYMENINSRIKKKQLTTQNIDLVRDDVIRYNLMLCRGGPDLTMENMEFVENDLDDKELRELYTYIVRVSGVTLEEFVDFYNHFEDYDLLVDAYKGLIHSEQLSMDAIEDYRHDLEKYNLMEMAYRVSAIPAVRVTMDNIEDVREDLEKYNLMEMAYKESIIPEGSVTMSNIEQVREDLKKYDLIEMAYKRSIIPEQSVTMNNIEQAREDLEKYNLVGMAYEKSIIAGRHLTMDNIKEARKDLQKYGLMKMAYKESIIAGHHLTMDNLKEARTNLKQFGLMTMAYKDSIIAGGYLTIHDMKANHVRKDLKKYGLMKMAYKECIINSGSLTMDNIESFRRDLEHYELISEAYEEMIRRHDITEDNMEIVRQDLEKYNLISKVGPAIK
eukprot:gene5090-6194_t